MPFELGGRADKQGNTYEYNCAIYEMLRILDEFNYSVVIEALGDDEKGTDILVSTVKGEKNPAVQSQKWKQGVLGYF